MYNNKEKIIIWDRPSGYSKKSKLDIMNIDYAANRVDAGIKYAKAINGIEYRDISRLADTFTYLHEIKGEYELETFEDKPYIIPYEVENSKYAVIVLSGGGFAYKTIDGLANGGESIAIRLNRYGISAYLLHYRTNPYKFPIPMLDIQRAIRYLRYHNDKFNFESDKLYLMGYSAGGYAVASFINQYLVKDFYLDEYEKDGIDDENDFVNKAILVYPQLTFNYHQPMLNTVFNKEQINTSEKRSHLLNFLDLKQNINSKNIMQFIAYGNKDETIPQESVEDYIAQAKSAGVNISRIFVPNGKHGFSDDLYLEELIKFIKF